MQLQLLHQTTCLTTYYDQCNDWLFLDWEGELTLPLVQEACDALATCVLVRPYARVLNSHEQVTGLPWNVATWLATEFLPHLAPASVECVAWIYAPLLRGQHMVHLLLRQLSSPFIDAFDNAADAVTWLQRCQPAPHATLARQAQAARQRLAA